MLTDKSFEIEIQSVADMLGRSFHNEPNFVYILPDEQARKTILRWFFQMVAIPASRLSGEIHTTKQMDGASLWIRPGSGLTFERMFRNGMWAMPFKLDEAIVRRSINLGTRVEKVRHQLVAEPHWYLLALGVEVSVDRSALIGLLTEPVLSRADSDKVPCYVETFQARDLCFYEKLGFRIEGAGDIPEGGPSFWAMIRQPR